MLVEPLFNACQPIPAGPVHDAVASMAARAGIPLGPALKSATRADALASALVKTAEYRHPRPGRVEEFDFYDHPLAGRRVLTAMLWKAAHPAPPAQ